MALIGNIVIGMGVNTAMLESGLSKARGLVGGFVRRVTSVQGVLAGALGGVGLGAGILKAVDAASDLNEQVSKAGVVFGDSAKDVIAEAEAMADRFGVVRTSFLDAASSIGLIGQASGLAERDAAQLGITFAKLGVDASSFFNVPVEDALTALRSGLVGEAEPLRRFGVLLNEDAVKAEAARMGIAKLGDELTEGQKVQARSAIILRGLAKASGDFERTSAGVANSTRSAWGRLENTLADAGKAFEPVTAAVLGLVNEGLGQLRGAVNSSKGDFSGLAEGVLGAIGMVGDSIEAVTFFWHLFAQAGLKAVSAITGGLSDLFGAIGQVVPGLEGVRDGLARIADNSWAGAMSHVQRAEAIVDPNRRSFSERLQQSFAEMRAGGASGPGVGGAVESGPSKAAVKLADDVEDLNAKLREQVTTFGMTSNLADVYKLKLKGASDEQLRNARALAVQLDAMQAQEKFLDQQADDAKSVIDATRTPLEKFRAELTKLGTLKDLGLLTGNQFDRAARQAREEHLGKAQFAGLAERDSAEARSAVLAHRGRSDGLPGQTGDAQKDVAKNTLTSVQVQQRMLTSLNNLGSRIGTALGNAFPEVFAF